MRARGPRSKQSKIVKLFQIEEPDGSPADPDMPGSAVGVDLSGATAEVAVAVGGNAMILDDRAGFELSLPVPTSADGDWELALVGARLRAERALARPVTHAAIVLGAVAAEHPVRQAAEAAGLTLLRLVRADELPTGEPLACAAAVIAEDLAPRPESL
jgi:hypothetical protein